MAARRIGTRPEIPKWVEQLPDTFLLCRDLGHHWADYQARFVKSDNVYERVLSCSRCATQRIQTLSVSGHVLGGHYTYTRGYLAPKGEGPHGGGDRDTLRLASITRLMEVPLAAERAKRRPRKRSA